MKNKTKVSLITMFLLFVISFPVVTTSNYPIAKAADTMQTYAFIGAMPNPVGVGQEVLLHVGITQALGAPSHGWEGLTVTVTKPGPRPFVKVTLPPVPALQA